MAKYAREQREARHKGTMSVAESKARDKYMSMTLMQLRRQCEDAWLSAAGSKDDLVDRLVDYEKPAGGWPSGFTFGGRTGLSGNR